MDLALVLYILGQVHGQEGRGGGSPVGGGKRGKEQMAGCRPESGKVPHPTLGILQVSATAPEGRHAGIFRREEGLFPGLLGRLWMPTRE